MKLTYSNHKYLYFKLVPIPITMVVYVSAYTLMECYCFIHQRYQMVILLFVLFYCTSSAKCIIHGIQKSEKIRRGHPERTVCNI